MTMVNRVASQYLFHKRMSAGGQYGFTKAVQKDVEVAIRKIETKIESLARSVESKHPEAGSYFTARSQSSTCPSAQALAGSCLVHKAPSRVLSGPLGFKPACAKACHKAISELIVFSGEVANTLFTKKRDHIPYLQAHLQETQCPMTQLLLEAHPVIR
jgi:hypothetical protein